MPAKKSAAKKAAAKKSAPPTKATAGQGGRREEGGAGEEGDRDEGHRREGCSGEGRDEGGAGEEGDTREGNPAKRPRRQEGGAGEEGNPGEDDRRQEGCAGEDRSEEGGAGQEGDPAKATAKKAAPAKKARDQDAPRRRPPRAGSGDDVLALIYDLAEDYLERRAAVARRAPRRSRGRAFARGELVLAGAFSDPYDRALLVWSHRRRLGRRGIRRRRIPYVSNGLVHAAGRSGPGTSWWGRTVD